MFDVSADLQRALIMLGLLVGPTCLWLLYRALRGFNEQEMTRYDQAGASAGSAEAWEPADGSGRWACGTCGSLNQPRERRCYKCSAPRAVPSTPVAVPVRGGPAMGTDAPAGPPAPRPGVPGPAPLVAAATTGGALEAAPRGRPLVAVMNPATVGGSSGAARAVAPIADTRLERPPATPVPVMDPDAVSGRPGAPAVSGRPGAPAVGGRPRAPLAPTSDDTVADRQTTPVVCPRLGLRHDPTPRFPDRAHRCAATPSPSVVPLAHQETFCFGAYPQCVHFRAYVEPAGSGPSPEEVRGRR